LAAAEPAAVDVEPVAAPEVLELPAREAALDPRVLARDPRVVPDHHVAVLAADAHAPHLDRIRRPGARPREHAQVRALGELQTALLGVVRGWSGLPGIDHLH